MKENRRVHFEPQRPPSEAICPFLFSAPDIQSLGYLITVEVRCWDQFCFNIKDYFKQQGTDIVPCKRSDYTGQVLTEPIKIYSKKFIQDFRFPLLKLCLMENNRQGPGCGLSVINSRIPLLRWVPFHHSWYSWSPQSVPTSDNSENIKVLSSHGAMSFAYDTLQTSLYNSRSGIMPGDLSSRTQLLSWAGVQRVYFTIHKLRKVQCE